MIKETFDPRKMMELAIEAMRKSVSEHRTDGKASPLVGVALWKADGSVNTAYRGELRDGDHAEFTLLERKNRDQLLDGAVLFATLEPCAPGARRHPKLGCAERIVLARIKKVWIGIEDPDPKVDRKGIKYLEENGVEVNMFDRDLQEIIREANKEFLVQAMDRASVFKRQKKHRMFMLSDLENAFSKSIPTDFSNIALSQFKDISGISEEIGSSEFNHRLELQGLLKEDNGKLVPTGFGLLLFGKEPRTVMAQAGLLATIHYENGTEEVADFDGPMVLIPGQIEKWMDDKLPGVIDRSHMQQKNSHGLPFDIVREAVVNALVHRDYEIKGAKCQLIVTPDTIVVKSPGEPLHPITVSQLQSFNAPMLSRNPELHFVFSRMKLAEERGLGMKTLKQLPQKYGLPLPKYVYEGPYLSLTIYHSPEGVTRTLDPTIVESLNNEEKEGWKFLATQTSITAADYAKRMNFDIRKAQRHLKKFVQLRMLIKMGSGPATYYEVVRV